MREDVAIVAIVRLTGSLGNTNTGLLERDFAAANVPRRNKLCSDADNIAMVMCFKTVDQSTRQLGETIAGTLASDAHQRCIRSH